MILEHHGLRTREPEDLREALQLIEVDLGCRIPVLDGDVGKRRTIALEQPGLFRMRLLVLGEALCRHSPSSSRPWQRRV